MSGTRSPSPKAPVINAGALVLVSHGIGGGPGSAEAHAARLTEAGRRGAVRVACLHGEPRLEAVLDSLAGQPVDLVPLLIGDGHTMTELRRRVGGRPLVALRAPLGEHAGIDALIIEKAAEACAGQGWAPESVTLLLIGHGSARHPGNGQAMRRHVKACGAAGRFAGVLGGLLVEPPDPVDLVGGLAYRPCVVVGLFMDEGPHGRDDVRAALRSATVPVAYAGALGADPRIAGLVLDGGRADRNVA